MGNRAVIVHKSALKDGQLDPHAIGIYLHWNGGKDSINAFLKYCEMKEYRNSNDVSYQFARLVQTIANYFDDGLSVGVGQVCCLDYDNFDNGTYVIDNWRIIDRLYFNMEEQNNLGLAEMMIQIDKRQPEKTRVGARYVMDWLAANRYI